MTNVIFYLAPLVYDCDEKVYCVSYFLAISMADAYKSRKALYNQINLALNISFKRMSDVDHVILV